MDFQPSVSGGILVFVTGSIQVRHVCDLRGAGVDAREVQLQHACGLQA
jgi:hypothetical protein